MAIKFWPHVHIHPAPAYVTPFLSSVPQTDHHRYCACVRCRAAQSTPLSYGPAICKRIHDCIIRGWNDDKNKIADSSSRKLPQSARGRLPPPPCPGLTLFPPHPAAPQLSSLHSSRALPCLISAPHALPLCPPRRKSLAPPMGSILSSSWLTAEQYSWRAQIERTCLCMTFMVVKSRTGCGSWEWPIHTQIV